MVAHKNIWLWRLWSDFTRRAGPAPEGAVFRNSEEFWDSFLLSDSMNCTTVTLEGAEVLHLDVNQDKTELQLKSNHVWKKWRQP